MVGRRNIRKTAATTLVFAIALFGSTTIREVDFRNFDYPWDDPVDFVPSTWKWLEGKPQTRVRVVGGRHVFSLSEPLAEGYLRFYSASYGDLDGDGRDEVAVDLLCSTGGTANWHYLYVFTLVGGSPTLLARLESGSRADGGLLRVAIERRTLILDFADGERRFGDCCSEGYIRVRYRLKAGHFVEVGTRVSGDLNLANPVVK